jgi:hypothetical protein
MRMDRIDGAGALGAELPDDAEESDAGAWGGAED